MQFPIFLVSIFVSITLGSVTATCLQNEDAKRVASNFATFFSDFSEEFINKTMAIDFTDQTDSVCWLKSNGTNCPCQLGTLTLDSRRAFLDAQAEQPNLPFGVLNVWHDCTHAFVRWKFDVLPQPVQGLAVLQTILNPDRRARANEKYLIKHVFSEFNSGAFAVDLGDFVGTPPPECTNPSRRGLVGKSSAWMDAEPRYW